MFKVDVCKKCMEFCKRNEDNNTANEVLISDYRKLMTSVLKNEFHISKKASKSVIDSLGYGNWKHLWMTDEEKSKSIEEIKDTLIGEIFYCSDRWSWDRVLRVNWVFLRLLEKLNSVEKCA